jgi:hypothetical protein
MPLPAELFYPQLLTPHGHAVAQAAYETARTDGLCEEGAWECAITAVSALDTTAFIPHTSPIVGYVQDEVGDWCAILHCGHLQHVRHNPPFVNRPWVNSTAGRAQFLGHPLICAECAAQNPAT